MDDQPDSHRGIELLFLLSLYVGPEKVDLSVSLKRMSWWIFDIFVREVTSKKLT